MGYLDETTDADLFALTRLRRAERAAAAPPPPQFLRTPRNEAQMRAWKDAEWAAGNRRCAYCNARLYRQSAVIPFDCPLLASVDHRHPLGRGGEDEPWNYAMACVECNNAKGDMLEEEFVALFASLAEPRMV